MPSHPQALARVQQLEEQQQAAAVTEQQQAAAVTENEALETALARIKQFEELVLAAPAEKDKDEFEWLDMGAHFYTRVQLAWLECHLLLTANWSASLLEYTIQANIYIVA